MHAAKRRSLQHKMPLSVPLTSASKPMMPSTSRLLAPDGKHVGGGLGVCRSTLSVAFNTVLFTQRNCFLSACLALICSAFFPGCSQETAQRSEPTPASPGEQTTLHLAAPALALRQLPTTDMRTSALSAFVDAVAQELSVRDGITFRGRMGDAGHALANIERGLLLWSNGSSDGYQLAVRSGLQLTQSLQDCRALLVAVHAPKNYDNSDVMISYLTACHALASWCEWSLLQENVSEVTLIMKQLKSLRTNGHHRFAHHHPHRKPPINPKPKAPTPTAAPDTQRVLLAHGGELAHCEDLAHSDESNKRNLFLTSATTTKNP